MDGSFSRSSGTPISACPLGKIASFRYAWPRSRSGRKSKAVLFRSAAEILDEFDLPHDGPHYRHLVDGFRIFLVRGPPKCFWTNCIARHKAAQQKGQVDCNLSSMMTMSDCKEPRADGTQFTNLRSQKIYFIANCQIRGSPALSILPKFELVIVPLGLLKFG